METIWPGLFALIFFVVIVVILFIIIPIALSTGPANGGEDEPVEDFL